MLPEQPKPTCGVVIEKQGDLEVICPELAVDMTSIVDPDNQARVTAVLLTCEKHSKDLEEGKSLIFVAEDKEGKPTERIAVNFVVEHKEESNDAEPTNEQ